MDKQQIKEILNNAPEGATHASAEDTELYYKEDGSYYALHKGRWSRLSALLGSVSSLSDLRTQLALIEENEKLKTEVKRLEQEVKEFKEIARQYTELASKGVYYSLDELAQHDKEVAIKAIKDLHKYVVGNFPNGFLTSTSEYLEQLQEQE